MPDYDVLIIGSGPGGAGVARELARAGRRVLILERGHEWRGDRLYGTYPGALLYADRHALIREIYARYRIEVPVVEVNGQRMVRISCHIYNRAEDYERLGEAIMDLLA